MNYPADVETAHSFFQARFSDLYNNPKKQNSPRILEMFGKEFASRYGRANMAGMIAQNVIALNQQYGSASLNKAAFIASEYALSIPSEGRKRGLFPSSRKDILKAFREFRDVSHFWAALQITKSDPVTLSNDREAFLKFLHAAAMLLFEFERATPDLEMNPWRIPDPLICHLDGMIHSLPSVELDIEKYSSSDWG